MIKNGSVLAGRYEILEKIGSGGMADVYKASDRKMKREVAVKVLKTALTADREYVKRFQSEGQAAASLSNPNIISVYDVGNEGSTYYIVMELINGITLKEYIRRKGMLSARETMAISAQVAVGLRSAHARHIVHRDIKPQNIILSRDGKVKVTDFGIARTISDETKSVNNATLGSVHYIAPEQAKGQICDERSDIYSLGICMYEMITGRVPFDKETSIAIALAHMNETMVPPSELNAECPTALEQIIFRCTQKSRERRYHNCTELLQDLKIAVASPDFDFERQEQENLMKSDTQVFTKKAADAPVVTDPEETEEPRKATTIVDSFSDEEEAEDDDRKTTYVGATGENRPMYGEDEEEDSEASNTAKNLFAEDRKEDDKSLFDRIIMIVGIVIGAIIICLILYIVMTLSGCTQKFGKKPTTTAAPTSVFTEDETDEIISLETVPSEAFDPKTDTIVPNVTGMSIQAAIALLQESELMYKISSKVVYSDEFKIGMIAGQSNEEGTIVKKGSTIVITLSAGTDKFEIKPSYIGGPLAVFKNDISNFEDVIDVTYEKQNSDKVKANYIISISPSSGIIEAGQSIHVIYSAGPEYVACPNLIGATYNEAAGILLGSALNMGMTSYAYSDSIEANRIMDQQYAPGTVLKNGTTVSITVSKGPEMVEVLSVAGKKLEDAKKTLEEAGFVVEVTEVYDAEIESGYVIEQDLEAGTTVKKGETIVLTVSKGGETILPVLKDAGEKEATDVLKGMGYTVNVIFEDTDDYNLNKIVKSMSPDGGTSLEPGSEVTLIVYRYVAPETEPSSSETAPTTPTDPTDPTEPTDNTAEPPSTSAQP